jgi:hypothetical protein
MRPKAGAVADDAGRELSDSAKLGHYVDLYKQAVQTQQHFNDIEWRIRGLALTAATFALGAAGFATKDQPAFHGISLGTVVVIVGLILWYAFYFVDRYWYHPLLKASVAQGTLIEREIQRFLPAAGMTQAITEGSRYRPTRLVRLLSGTSDEMRSDDKLLWFYKVGAGALVVVAVGLQLVASLADRQATPDPATTVVKIEQPRPTVTVTATPTLAPPSSVSPTP